jgi:hypothetical protein
MKKKLSYYIMEQLLQQVENDINKYGNVRPATLKKLEKVMKEHQVLEGKGIVSNVKNYFHKALTSRPGVVDRLIKQYGDRRVMQVTILRKPVQGGVQKLLNLITLGGFNRAKNEMKYDEVYHLYVNMTLDNGQTIGIEKNQRVNVAAAGFPTAGLEASNMLKINCNVVFKDMIEKAEQAGGDTFYRYNAVTANCQRFISVLMNSSGITGTDAFVMQDATQLIKNSGLRRVAGAITDVAALGERAILGHGRDQPQCTCGKPRAERRQKKPRKRKNNKKVE